MQIFFFFSKQWISFIVKKALKIFACENVQWKKKRFEKEICSGVSWEVDKNPRKVELSYETMTTHLFVPRKRE